MEGNFSATWVQGNYTSRIISNSSHSKVPDSHSNHFIGELSDDKANRILWILTFVVIPLISILGIMGNIFSIIILKKHGLRKKCSNILLFSLAISDICYLIGFNNIAKMFYDFGKVKGLVMPYTSAYVMYLIYTLCDVLDWGGGAVSFSIPVLITIERLVAVFLPLRFPLIITPKRTALAVSCVYVFWFSIMIYTRFWFQFAYSHKNNNPYNVSVGSLERSDLFFAQLHVSDAIKGLIINLGATAPLPIVAVGCICIGIKVRITSIKRLKLTAVSTTTSKEGDNKKSVDMSKTTRTLLSVCSVYSVACMFTTLPQHLPQFMVYTLFTDSPNNTARVIYVVMNGVNCINSSCNFLIYVLTNKKFRDTQREILRSCFCSNRKTII